MIIDFHTHIFPDKISAEVVEKLSRTSKTIYFNDGTLRGLLNSMKKAEINKKKHKVSFETAARVFFR